MSIILFQPDRHLEKHDTQSESFSNGLGNKSYLVNVIESLHQDENYACYVVHRQLHWEQNQIDEKFAHAMYFNGSSCETWISVHVNVLLLMLTGFHSSILILK